jgi:ribonuclease HII
VCACILPKNYKNDAIRDSKKLSISQREVCYNKLLKDCIEYTCEFINAQDVDKYNPKRASIIGMEKCIANLKHKPDICLIDAERINKAIKHESIIKGDDKSISIAAASIIAKVTRDRYMDKMNDVHKGYGFDKNKGYGTKSHVEGIKKYGVIKNFHRISYKPIKAFLEEDLFH